MPRTTLKTGLLKKLLLPLALEPNAFAIITKMFHWTSSPIAAGLQRTRHPCRYAVWEWFSKCGTWQQHCHHLVTWLKMQILRAYPKAIELMLWEWGLMICVCDACKSLKTTTYLKFLCLAWKPSRLGRVFSFSQIPFKSSSFIFNEWALMTPDMCWVCN